MHSFMFYYVWCNVKMTHVHVEYLYITPCRTTNFKNLLYQSVVRHIRLNIMYIRFITALLFSQNADNITLTNLPNIATVPHGRCRLRCNYQQISRRHCGLMLGQRRIRWFNIQPTQVERLVLAVYTCVTWYSVHRNFIQMCTKCKPVNLILFVYMILRAIWCYCEGK